MMNDKRNKLKKEAAYSIIEVLQEGYNGYYCDLHQDVFNIVETYIYYADAIEDLNEYGVFNAIEEVKQYEQFNFGEVNTDFSNPCEVANMLWYIIGEEVMLELPSFFDEVWDEIATEEVNNKIIDYLKNVYGELV